MNNRKHYEEVLMNIYNVAPDKIKNLTTTELQTLLKQKEKDQITVAKNPNQFWYIKGMPTPKQFETKTSKWYGAAVVGALFLILIGFLIIFIVLAWINN